MRNNFIKLFVFWATILTACFIIANSVKAEGIWVDATIHSYHQDRAANYNERNWGMGLSYQASPTWTVSGGQYRNSFYKASKYFGVTSQPFVYGGWRAGLSFLEVSGYEPENLARFTPVAIPMVSWDNTHVGTNIVLIPPFKRASGVIAIQFKVRVF